VLAVCAGSCVARLAQGRVHCERGQIAAPWTSLLERCFVISPPAHFVDVVDQVICSDSAVGAGMVTSLKRLALGSLASVRFAWNAGGQSGETRTNRAFVAALEAGTCGDLPLRVRMAHVLPRAGISIR